MRYECSDFEIGGVRRVKLCGLDDWLTGSWCDVEGRGGVAGEKGGRRMGD